jgi:hypothetical protein
VPPLAVIAYPTLASKDLAWIQEVRAAHDELYFKLIDPHFTFVFPTETLDERELIAHVQDSAGSTARIDFTLRCAVVGRRLAADLARLPRPGGGVQRHRGAP